MKQVTLKCKKCGKGSELQVRTKNQLVAHLRKGRRCKAYYLFPEDACGGEIEVVEPEEWRGA